MKFTEVSLFDLQPFSVSATKSNLADRSPSELAEEAINRAYDAAMEAWRRKALAELEDLCKRKQYVSADDLKCGGGNAIGGLFRAAVRVKMIRFSGQYVSSRTPKAHGRMLRLWQSLIYED